MADHRSALAMMRLPNPEFARTFLVDGAVLWVLLRFALYVVGAVAADQFGAPTMAIGAPAAFTLVVVSGGLTLLDVLRRRESILLANLGVPLRAVVIVGAIPALVGEVVIGILTMAAGS